MRTPLRDVPAVRSHSAVFRAWSDCVSVSSKLRAARDPSCNRSRQYGGNGSASSSQVYAAGRALYSRHRAYIEDEADSDSKRLLNKFIFIAGALTPALRRLRSLRSRCGKQHFVCGLICLAILSTALLGVRFVAAGYLARRAPAVA
eukprot:5458823-Pleurochrysis_carterae.AAC.3